MEYMKRQGKLVEAISALRGYRIPSASRQGINLLNLHMANDRFDVKLDRVAT